MSKSNFSCSDLIDAKLEEHQMCGSKHCPGCGHKLEGKPDWVGLPAGVKFDPTDQELIEHLEAKVEAKDMKSHPLIDEFIPTIEGEDGICYTHPEKLPGVTRDGLSRHFFHRPSKAYTTGTRKRRKIQTECDHLQAAGGETRWHKTGKTRPVMVNGKQKGCKKILVLYTNFGKNRRPEKTNWVMHQYHLGLHEEEKEGELVVSKIFYQTQPRQCNYGDRSVNNTVISTATTTTGGVDHHDHPNSSRRDHSGSGSCSSSKDVNNINNIPTRDHDMSVSGAIAAAAAMSSYTGAALDIHHFGFAPSREMGIGEASLAREAAPPPVVVSSGGACDEIGDHHQRLTSHHVAHDHHHQHQQQQQQQQMHHHHAMVHHHQNIGDTASTAAFHISRPSHPISTIISPPPLHHTSIILEDDPYHVSRIMLQNEIQQQQHQQQQQQQQQHHKMGGRSAASGLEELIMGCTSSTDIKAESSIANQQEAEWLKYSSFWPEPDNQDHHG